MSDILDRIKQRMDISGKSLGIKWLTILVSLRQYHFTIINKNHFYSQQCPGLDTELYAHFT